jgi:uncharacterized protein
MDYELSSEERNWAMAAHLCGLLWLAGGTGLLFIPFGGLVLFTVLGPLIIWRTKGETMPFVASQAKEALNFQITVLLLGLLNLILVIVAAIQVSSGKAYRYPFCLRLVK